MSQTTNSYLHSLGYGAPDEDSAFISNIVDEILTINEDGTEENIPFVVYMGSNFHAVLNDNYTKEDGVEPASVQRLIVEDFPMKVGDIFKRFNKEDQEWENYDEELVLLGFHKTELYSRDTYSITYAKKNSDLIKRWESINLHDAQNLFYGDSEIICQAGKIRKAFEANFDEFIPTGKHIELNRDILEEYATEPITLLLDIHIKKWYDGTYHLDLYYKAKPRCLHDGGYLGEISKDKNFDVNDIIEKEKQSLQRSCGTRRPITVKTKIKDDRISQSLDSFF